MEPKIVLWKLTSHSGSGTAHYECQDERMSYLWGKRVDIRGRYPKMWRQSLIRKGFRELTETEKLLYGET